MFHFAVLIALQQDFTFLTLDYICTLSKDLFEGKINE
jgi:hypothetical protein